MERNADDFTINKLVPIFIAADGYVNNGVALFVAVVTVSALGPGVALPFIDRLAVKCVASADTTLVTVIPGPEIDHAAVGEVRVLAGDRDRNARLTLLSHTGADTQECGDAALDGHTGLYVIAGDIRRLY